MKNWQPHVDLHRLTVALSEEIIAAPEQEVRRVHVESGVLIAAAAQDVRSLIAAASGEADRPEHSRTAGVQIYVS